MVRCPAEVVHPFSPDPPVKALGPTTNRGQKGGALVDYLTVVFPEDRLGVHGLTRLDHLLETLFSFNDRISHTGWRDKRWMFYPQSTVLRDREGEVIGRCGRNGGKGTVCISLTGMGCTFVNAWANVAAQVQRLGGRITRCDLAFDDYLGEILDVHAMRIRARNQEFMQGGTPPKWRFIDDEGCGTGSTLYVGSKGHKELCVYEKGKQLGFEASPWVRAEVRLYGKHGDVPVDVLTDPLAFLRGAYDVLALLLLDVAPDACTRIKTKRRQVEASGEAMVRYLRRQVGPSLNVLLEAFGGSWADFMQHRIVRTGSPGRFRGHPKGEKLAQLLREELCRDAK